MGERQLTKKQREYLYKCLGEGMTLAQINKQAEFGITQKQYSKARKHALAGKLELKKQGNLEALKSGLALSEKRVEKLKALAEQMYKELVEEDKLWLDEPASLKVARDEWEIYTKKVFNRAEVDALRGLLDDIAREVGGRIHRVDTTSKDKPIKSYMVISPDDWDAEVNG